MSWQWKMCAEDEEKKSVVADVSGCLLTITDSCCVRRRAGSRSRVPGWRDESGPQKSSPWHAGSVISTWIISRAMTRLSASWLCSCLRDTSPRIWPKLDICQTPVPLQSDPASGNHKRTVTSAVPARRRALRVRARQPWQGWVQIEQLVKMLMAEIYRREHISDRELLSNVTTHLFPQLIGSDSK